MSRDVAMEADGLSRTQRNRLTPPKRAGHLCERVGLLRRLDDSTETRATFIVGAAGYGKTTLVAQWCERLRTRGMPFGYYLAAEQDREPATFLLMLAAALERAGIDLSDSPVRMDRSTPPEVALEDLLLRLELAGNPLTVIIDDLEKIDSGCVLDLVRKLIVAAPPTFKLLVCARMRSPIGLTALALRGDVDLIDGSQLRLSRQEVASVFELPETSRTVVRIAELTQGWPVTVQLYRLWLLRQPPAGGAIEPGGQVHEINDYLTEELFSSLPEEQFTLLVDVAECDEIEPGLVDFMRTRTDSATLLEAISCDLSSLMQANGAGADLAYRLHPLLIDYLRGRLARDPPRRGRLLARAAAWYLREQRHPEAVRMAVRSRDREVIDGIVGALRPLHILLAEGVPVLRAILHELPEHVVQAYPRLRIMAAIAHFKAGFFAEAQAMLRGVRADTEDYCVDRDFPPAALKAEGTLAELIVLVQISRFPATLDTLYDSVVAAARDDAVLWGAAENVRMLIAQGRGDLVTAKQSIAKTRRIYQSVGLTRYGDLQVIGHELLVALAEGTLRRVVELIAEYQKWQSLDEIDETGAPAMLKIVLAAVRYERECSEAAVDMLKRGLSEHGSNESWFDQYAITLPPIVSQLHLRHGERAAQAYLDEFADRARRSGIEALPRFIEFLSVEHLARAGDLDAARARAQALDLDAWVPGAGTLADLPSWRERDAGSQALIVLRLREGGAAEALELASAMADTGRSRGRLRTVIKGLVFAAIAQDALGAGADALDTLHQAVRLAGPEGFVAPFAEEGAALTPLIGALIDQNSLDTYAARHARAIDRAIRTGASGTASSNLNPREQAILVHLAAGASNKVIARKMGVTDNTVKFHLKKVFAKLDVSTRRAAAAKVTHEMLASPSPIPDDGREPQRRRSS